MVNIRKTGLCFIMLILFSHAKSQSKAVELFSNWEELFVLETGQCIEVQFELTNFLVDGDATDKQRTELYMVATNAESYIKCDYFEVLEDDHLNVSVFPGEKELSVRHSTRSDLKELMLSNIIAQRELLFQMIEEEHTEVRRNGDEMHIVSFNSIAKEKFKVRRMELRLSENSEIPSSFSMIYTDQSLIRRTEVNIIKTQHRDVPGVLMQGAESYIFQNGRLKPEYADFKVSDYRKSSSHEVN